jgi:biopolymer transport protein ExbD
MKIKSRLKDARVAIDMTPMIDVIFQLLAFFIMTLRIGPSEGEFNIGMPAVITRAGARDLSQLRPIKLRLRADAAGNLTELLAGERSFTGPDRFQQITRYVEDYVGDAGLITSAEVELDCDYRLKYEHVIDTITAVSGKVVDGRIVKLVEKIRFAPPREDRP